MRNWRIVKLVHREIKALLKLSPWVLVSLFLAAVLWRTDLAAISGLFQSPATPTATSELPTPTQGPTELPTEEPTVAPTFTTVVTPTATLTPTQTTATPAPTIELTVTPTGTLATATPQISPTVEAEGTPDESGRYASEDTTLRFDWGVLFDSVALGLSYVWLCCGILLFLSIPVVFVLLSVASKRKQQEEE
jgi:hypothetical protein